eukprot:4164140-Pyramimonas_sp.AAC.1
MPALRTAGWSVVVLDAQGAIVAEAWGRVPPSLAPSQSARDGEDFAVAQAARCILGACVLVIDCKATVACARAPGWAARPRAAKGH